MARLYANWVHGTSVHMQREGYFISKYRAGYGAHFASHNPPLDGKLEGEWFHFAIPTPVIIANQRCSLNAVAVLFKTELTAKITAIHLYDAGKDLRRFSNLSVAGDHTGGMGPSNTWNLSPPGVMYHGLDICVHVDFGPATEAGVPGIWFMAAGAHFYLE